jgi:hypothetical protein
MGDQEDGAQRNVRGANVPVGQAGHVQQGEVALPRRQLFTVVIDPVALAKYENMREENKGYIRNQGEFKCIQTVVNKQLDAHVPRETLESRARVVIESIRTRLEKLDPRTCQIVLIVVATHARYLVGCVETVPTSAQYEALANIEAIRDVVRSLRDPASILTAIVLSNVNYLAALTDPSVSHLGTSVGPIIPVNGGPIGFPDVGDVEAMTMVGEHETSAEKKLNAELAERLQKENGKLKDQVSSLKEKVSSLKEAEAKLRQDPVPATVPRRQ